MCGESKRADNAVCPAKPRLQHGFECGDRAWITSLPGGCRTHTRPPLAHLRRITASVPIKFPKAEDASPLRTRVLASASPSGVDHVAGDERPAVTGHADTGLRQSLAAAFRAQAVEQSQIPGVTGNVVVAARRTSNALRIKGGWIDRLGGRTADRTFHLVTLMIGCSGF
jgi:hypothetical protein